MVLRLGSQYLWDIRAHAESTYPDECCGLLLGKIAQDSKTLVEVIATENVWSAETAKNFSSIDAASDISYTQRSHYAIAPEIMLKVQKSARDRQLNIIGIYHSHPDHAAIPSECDRVYAWYEYSYIIVSVHQGKASDLKSWSLDNDHQFQSEEIITVKSS